MDTGTFRGLITLILIIGFVGIVWWAYSKRRKPDFEEAANLPFADDDESLPGEKTATHEKEADNTRHDRGEKTHE